MRSEACMQEREGGGRHLGKLHMVGGGGGSEAVPQRRRVLHPHRRQLSRVELHPGAPQPAALRLYLQVCGAHRPPPGVKEGHPLAWLCGTGHDLCTR